jgi:hypothetical protein
MGDVIDFEKPRPPLSPQEQLFNSIVRALQDMTPHDRMSVIASSCSYDDWWELFKFAAYCIGAEQYTALSDRLDKEAVPIDNEAVHRAILYPLQCTLKGVIEEGWATVLPEVE